MPVNVAPSFSADIENFIADKTLDLAQRQLVFYQFGDMESMPEGRGTTFTMTRFLRLPLPYAPLSEAVPPVGQTMSIQQVSAVAQQWGDKVTLTDVAELTIKHPLVKQAQRVMGYQIAETLDRNTIVNLLGGTQVNFVNSRGSRPALQAADYMNRHEVQRAVALLLNLGAPLYLGDERTDQKIDAGSGGAKSSSNPRTNQHYVAMLHPFVEADMREDATVTTAWSYSDLNKIYNNELGELNGVRFCRSNMIPSFTGFANNDGGLAYVPGNSGSLATNAGYRIIVTGVDTQNQFESRIYTVSGAQSVTGPNGSIAVTLPNNAPGFTFNVYIGTTTSPVNLGVSPQGPASGPLLGQATQLPGGTTVFITGIGVAQVPPAFPGNANGITVYPTFIFGKGAYAQIELQNVQIVGLFNADKSDPLNQIRVIGWKVFYATLIKNNQFFMRIESTASNTGAFG